MRIGIMLRCADETGGIGIYARNITRELLEIDHKNEYVLLYRTDKHLGLFSHYANAKELLVRAPSKLLWDQVAIPYRAGREKIDLLFHPKFTVPFLTRAKTVMVVHGADWFIPGYDRVYDRLDTLYIKLVMPLYFARVNFVVSVSDYSTDGFVARFPQHKNKIKTVYFGPHEVFRRIENKAFLGSVKDKYNLPDRFILTVVRYDTPRTNKRKNLKRMFEAYRLCRERDRIPHKFVVVGKNCHLYAKDYDVAGMGIEADVMFPGLVEQNDLPAFYCLAELYLYPTIIEAFPIPITEAISCGCPIVTSHDTGLKEISADAAIHVDPNDPEAISRAVLRVIRDQDLRNRLIEKGLARAKQFSWKKCAVETLLLLEDIAVGKQPNHP